MQTYLTLKTLIAHTETGKRIKLERGVRYDGGFDFENLDKNRVFLLVKADGHEDKVFFVAGSELFLSNFEYIGHTDKPHHERVEIVKRPRISK